LYESASEVRNVSMGLDASEVHYSGVLAKRECYALIDGPICGPAPVIKIRRSIRLIEGSFGFLPFSLLLPFQTLFLDPCFIARFKLLKAELTQFLLKRHNRHGNGTVFPGSPLR